MTARKSARKSARKTAPETPDTQPAKSVHSVTTSREQSDGSRTSEHVLPEGQ